MNYRNPKLLKVARDVPHCMLCGKTNDGTIVAAHSNQQRDGKGMGIKAHDYRIAYLCSHCHTSIDRYKGMTRAEAVAAWEDAHRDTIGWIFESCEICV